MRKLLSQTLSAALALSVAVSATAGPVRKASANMSVADLLTAPVKAKTQSKGLVTMPKTKKATTRNLSKVRTGAIKGQKTPAKVKFNTEGSTTATGLMIYSPLWPEDAPAVGMYKVNSAAYTDEMVATLSSAGTTAYYADNKYYTHEVMEFWGMYLGTIVTVYDTQTWTQLSQSNPDVPYTQGTDPKQNPADGKVYANVNVLEGEDVLNQWGTYDTATGEFNAIADVDYNLSAMVFVDGFAYAVDYDGNLMKIDPATGTATPIGSTGVANQYLTSAFYDKATGKMMYANNTDTEASLYAIDLTNAATAKVYDFQGEEIIGMFVPYVPAAAAPAAPTAATIATDGGSLTYTVTVTAPTVCYDGSTLAADGLTYKVIASDQEFTGTIAPGASVNISVTQAEAGFASVRATLSNAAGESFPATARTFVGPDQLSAVSNVTLTDDNAGKFTLTWTAPQPVNGGYFDPSQLTYTVTDKDGNVVAEGLTVTTLEIPYTAPEELTSYQYSVAAVYMGATYQAVASNAVSKGSLEPPFNCEFATPDDMKMFTIIDANGDGKQWTFYTDQTTGATAARMGYNGSQDMDDWLVLPGLKLMEGKSYKFSVDVRGNSTSYVEKFEVKVGNAANPEAMTTYVIQPTEVASKQYATYKGEITVDQSGVYYIGIHGISAADMYFLFVDNIKVSAPIDPNGPAQPTDVTVTPAADGSLSATVSFTAPTTKINGEAIGTMTKATVTRADGTVVGTVDAPVAGQTYTVTDASAPAGQVTYNVVVSNESGDSEPVSVSTFVGFNVPAAIQNVVATETAEGQVKLTWDAVTTDTNGLTLPAGTVTYAVYTLDGSGRTKVVDGLTENTYSYTAVAQGQQEMLQYAVFAVSSVGEGEGNVSDMISVGTPYATPFKESFAGRTLAYNWMLFDPNPEQTMDANLGDDTVIQDIASQDGDNGFMYFKGQYLEDAAGLISGKIAIPAEGPTALTFYLFGISPDAGNEVTVSVLCDGNETVLGTDTPLADMSWVRFSHDLSAFAGKTVVLKFTCVVKAYAYIFLDNMTVDTPRNNDLAVTAFSAPAKVKAGNDIELSATLENRGVLEATAYTVDFYMNGQLLTSEAGEALASGAKTTVTATVTTNPLTADELEFFAVVTFAADEDTDNNTSATAKTAVLKSNVPAPTGLTGEVVDGNVVLTWDACNSIEGAGETVTEDFENAVTGAHEVEGWTIVDVDGKGVGGIQGKTVPGIELNTPSSFVVFEATGDFSGDTFTAHSGTKYLISMFNYDASAVSDWAISPELSGNAQTISFWARSYNAQYPEKIKVHYATSETTNPADFTQVTAFGTQTIGKDWTEYTFEVPAGAKHFAIESCATDAFFLMLDDVTFERAGGSLTLQGYNVYYNGYQANAETVEGNGYTHAPDANGTHTYHVTAVYDKGESRPSNAHTVDYNSVGNLSAGVNVVALHNEIVVTGAAGAKVAVFAADGKQVAARQSVDATRIKVQSGVYVVTVGQRTVKVAVK